MSTKPEREAVSKELARITDNQGGMLTPDAVVFEASYEDNVLHRLFEWDDTIAGNAWRVEQARELIRTVRVVVTTKTTQIRVVGYVRDPDQASDQQGYVPTVSLVGENERAGRALAAEFERAGSIMRRAHELAEAFELQGEVFAVVEKVDLMKTQVTSRIGKKAA